MDTNLILISNKKGAIFDFLDSFYDNTTIFLYDLVDTVSNNFNNYLRHSSDFTNHKSKGNFYFDILNSANFHTKFNVNKNSLYYEKKYKNPLEFVNIIESLFDNNFNNIQIYINLDKYLFININKSNYNYIIKYLFERYPY